MSPLAMTQKPPILVASANIFRRELILFQLGEAGYRVQEAHDAAMLQHMLHSVQPAILILDASLPNIEQALRQHRTRSRQPALILITCDTANPSPPRQLQSWGSYTASLPWPHEQHDLLQTVRHMLPIAAPAPIS